MRLVGFAEKVMYKLPPKGPQHDPHGNVSERWLSGIFLGYKRSSNSYVIGVDEGIATSRAVQRRPLENRWEMEAISQLKAPPWSTRAKRDHEVHFEQEAPKDEPVKDDMAINPRRLKLMYSDFVEHGFTGGCKLCDYMQQYKKTKGGLQHTETWRARMMAELGKTVAGQLRLERCEDRINEALARHVEREDTRQSKAQAAGEPIREPTQLGEFAQAVCIDSTGA